MNDNEVIEDEWNTEDLDKLRYTAGKLDEMGVVIIPEEMETKDGKNAEGRAVDLVFSSAKLTAIFDAHWAEMKGKPINVSGTGISFDRQYKVRMV